MTLLQSLATESGGISLVWFAGTCFSIALILIGVVWREQVTTQKAQIKEQKELNTLITSLSSDLKLIRQNMEHSSAEISKISVEVELIRRDLERVDKRVVKLEAVK